MASQRLGQHFLEDSTVVETIVEAAELRPTDTVVEIGPGRGALTSDLVAGARRALLIEYDTDLANQMAARYESNTTVRVLHADAREFGADLDPWLRDTAYKVVGNLPYYAANPILRNFLESTRQPEVLVVMVQREVGRDITANPGRMSLLSISVQVYAEVEQIIDVLPESFDPPPKVHSSVVRLKPTGSPQVKWESAEDFFRLVRSGFKSPRKQLHNSIADGLLIHSDDARKLLKQVGIEATRRPATLSIGEWQLLYDTWVDAGRPFQVPTPQQFGT